MVSSSENEENKSNAKSVLSDYHDDGRSALKEDMEDNYEAVTKRKFC